MKQKISILLFCIATLIPEFTIAQGLNVFAKQKVVIADIIDKNDRQISPTIKTLILQGLKDAISNSNEFELFEINMDDVYNSIKASGQQVSHSNICKKIREKGVDLIIFTDIKSSSSAFGSQSQNVTIFISTSLYRIQTASEILAEQDKAEPNEDSILATTSTMISRMLGIKPNTPNKQYLPQQPSQYQPPQQHYSNSGTGNVRFHNGATGVVVVLYDETGKHGLLISAEQNICNWDNAKTWCSSLGSGWHLPNSNELNLIYKNKNKINHILSQKGFNEIGDSYYWTNDVTSSNVICIISMFNGDRTYFNKSRLGVVRAVATF